MKTEAMHPIFLNGKWQKTESSMPVRAPFDGELLGYVCLAGGPEMELAIEKAFHGQERMRQWPAHKRSEFLNGVADALRYQMAEISALLSKEAGKPLLDAQTEVERAAETFRIAAEECLRLNGEIMPMDRSERGQGFFGYIRPFPIGPVAGISPFNFPLNLAAHKLAPAVAAGCPILLKPASSTPLSTLYLAKVFEQVGGLPDGAVSMLPCKREVGEMLVSDPRIRLLSFTGSDTVGWALKRRAGNKKVVLELGGNAAVIVGQTANWKAHIEVLAKASFAYSGQICIHPQRFYVWEGHFEAFSKAMYKHSRSLRLGPPQDPETQISCMIDETNAQRVDRWIDEAIEGGAKVIMRGRRDGSLLPPCILSEVPDGAKVKEEEVFGPVVILEPYSDIKHAIERVNQSRFGLQAAIYSEQQNEIEYAYQALHVGGLIVNAPPTLRFDHMPYGGVKDSGLGREGVRYAMADMLEWKIMVKKENAWI